MKRKERTAEGMPQITTKHPLKFLYQGVKLPILRTAFGAAAYVAGVFLYMVASDPYAHLQAGEVENMGQVFTFALALFVAYLVMFSSFVAELGFADLSAAVRKKVWHKVLQLPMRYFDRESPNRIISRVTNDPDYAASPFRAFSTVIAALVYLVMAFVTDTGSMLLTAILLAGFALELLYLIACTGLMKKALVKVTARLSDFTAFLSERFGNFKLVKALNSEEQEKDRSYQLIEERYKADLYNAFVQTVYSIGEKLSNFSIYFTTFVVGALLVRRGSITSSTQLIVFYNYGGILLTVLGAIAGFPGAFATGEGGTRKLVAMFEEPEEDTLSGRTDLPQTGDIALKGVSFSYDGLRKTLRDINLTIPRNKKTVILGHNGSGKTTLIKLLDRLYPDYEGELYLGQENGKDFSLKAWRDRIAVVSQDAKLFDGSLRDNLLYGLNREVPRQELDKVVALSGLASVVEEGGLDRQVGIGGTKLSGGERQRVAIARAMLKNPDYLILDEATANLDAKTEAQVLDGLRSLCQGRTVISIAHHYSAIKDADYAVVLEEGELIDAGTPKELRDRNALVGAIANTAPM